MDDNMKKLIEKYKQELMAAAGNSHTSAAPKPAAALDFPEMLPEEPAASVPDSPTEESARREDSHGDSLVRRQLRSGGTREVLQRPPAESTPDSAPESTPDNSTDFSQDLSKDFSQDFSPDDFSSLPPQFTDEAPQNDFTNDNVSPENNSVTDETEPGAAAGIPPGGRKYRLRPGADREPWHCPRKRSVPGGTAWQAQFREPGRSGELPGGRKAARPGGER